MNAPIACSLAPSDIRARRATIDGIARESLRSREPIEGGARLIFAPDTATENALRDLIAAEAECCPFLTMDLARGTDAVMLEVTGPEDAQPIIAELFART